VRPPPDDEEDYEVPQGLISFFRIFGWSEVTTKWRVVRFRRRVRALFGSLSPSRGNRRMVEHRLRDFPLVTLLLVLSFFVVYARMLVAAKGQGILGWDSPTLIRFGAYYRPALADGQFWRYGTAAFLHIGLWHLGFNAYALTQIGPMLEPVFGRGRVLFAFVFTAIVANMVCEVAQLEAVSAGASGGLMGLIGLAAAWGQRDGTSIGRNIRDTMLRWAVYTVIFGFFIHANNIAHVAGLVAGAAFGALFRPATLKATARGPVARGLGAIGLLLTLACVALCLVPPKYVSPADPYMSPAPRQGSATDDSD
jgi:rhomboid protease GluP